MPEKMKFETVHLFMAMVFYAHLEFQSYLISIHALYEVAHHSVCLKHAKKAKIGIYVGKCTSKVGKWNSKTARRTNLPSALLIYEYRISSTSFYFV